MSDTEVHSIRIPTPFAVGDVFAYLIIDDKIVLVDTGHYAEDAREVVAEHFGRYGLEIGDLDEIWLTHGHPDHYGQAARLSGQSGATVYGHRKERNNFAADNEGEKFEEFFRKHDIPEAFIEQMVGQLDWLQQYQQSIEPEWVEEGDILSSGSLNAEVHFTPGHAPGHLTFVTDRDMIFSGDLLLGHISTNALINFDADTGRRNRSLLQYRESLRWIRQLQGTVMPGHGEIIRDIGQVADHHLNEHKKRYQKIVELVQGQPMTLMELSLKMFPDAVKSGAVFLVLSEVLGYLDWGVEEGRIRLDSAQMKYKSVD